MDIVAWYLWAANLLFAINQIQYVQVRIHATRVGSRGEKFVIGRWFLGEQVLLVAVLVVACSIGGFPPYGAIAFAPVLIRGFAWFAAHPKPLAIHALGKSELVYSCVFGVLPVVGIRIG
jgi:hypothetical protein